MLLGSDNNENNNNNEEKLLNGATEGHTGLFNSGNDSLTDDIEGPSYDDLISSSFAVSFKANDPVNSVSEKLKETENLDRKINDPVNDGFKDEFDDFEFDSSFNPFKPIGSQAAAPVTEAPAPSPAAPVTPSSSETVPPAPSPVFGSPAEPSVRKPDDKLNEVVSQKIESIDKKADEIKEETSDFPFNPKTPTVEETKAADQLVFTNDDPDLKAFANADIKGNGKDLFNAGSDLDFAASSNSNSDFSNKNGAPMTPVEPSQTDDDLFSIPDDMKNVNPFKPAEPKAVFSAPAEPAVKPAEVAAVAAGAAGVAAAASALDDNKISEPNAPVIDTKPAEEPHKSSPFARRAAAPVSNEVKDESHAASVSPKVPEQSKTENAIESAPAVNAVTEPVIPEPVKPEPAIEEAKVEDVAKKGNVHTYGNVSSGVNAFGRRKNADAKPESPAAENAKAAPEIKKEDKSDDKNIGKAAVAGAAIATGAAAASVAADKKIENKAPEATDTKSKTVERHVKGNAPEEDSLKKETEGLRPGAVSDNKTSSPAANRRPVSAPAAAAAGTTSPFAPKGVVNKPPVPNRPAAPKAASTSAPKPQQHSSGSNIQPVTTVNSKKKQKKEKKKKENGVSGIISLIVVLLIFLLLIWFLDNYSEIKSKFGGKDKVETLVTAVDDTDVSESTDETEPTDATSESTEASETATSTPTPTPEATDTPTPTPSPEPTEEPTESTTEATEPTESTTETTEEPTETTTEATTESTTETTTEATTTESVTPSGDVVTSFTTHTANYTRLDSGFEFDLILENTGNRDAQLAVSINNISFRLRANSPITSVSSDSFVFNSDSSNANRFIATPNNITVPAGETYTAHIVVNTESSVNSYGMDSYFIDWNK